MDEAQYGFRKGRSTQDYVFTIKKIIEKNRTKNSEGYIAFLDLEKVFDRIPMKIVCKSLEDRRVNSKLLREIKNLYTENINY